MGGGRCSPERLKASRHAETVIDTIMKGARPHMHTIRMCIVSAHPPFPSLPPLVVVVAVRLSSTPLRSKLAAFSCCSADDDPAAAARDANATRRTHAEGEEAETGR